MVQMAVCVTKAHLAVARNGTFVVGITYFCIVSLASWILDNSVFRAWLVCRSACRVSFLLFCSRQSCHCPDSAEVCGDSAVKVL